MKVAIIGAGLSGLSCAHQLIRNGIVPTVFERNKNIGETFEFVNVNLRLFDMPIKNPLDYMEKMYNIHLKPSYQLKEIILVSSHTSYSYTGNLGYISVRGPYPESVENQLYNQTKVPVLFGQDVKPEDLINDFDNIVICQGHTKYANDHNIYNEFFNAYCRIAKFKADLNENSLKVWINKEYSRDGFAYMGPANKGEGRLCLIINFSNPKELDEKWHKFIKSENINYEFTDIQDLQHSVGNVYPIQTGKIILAGNSGGFIDSIFGFGANSAILSGAMAGDCIAQGVDYNTKMKAFTQNISNLHEFRKTLNIMNNKQIDIGMAIQNFPVIKQFIYNNPYFRMSHIIPFVKCFNYLKGI